MDSITRERVNDAAARGQAHREKALELANAHGWDHASVREELDAAERAYAEHASLRRASDLASTQSEIETWQGQLADQRVPAERYAIAPNDPTSTREYAAAYRNFIRSAAPDRRELFSDTDRASLSISSDGAGGYTVPADHRAQLLARLPAISKIFSLVTSFNTSRDRVDWPRMRRNTTSTAYGSIYTSLFVGSWSPEIPGGTLGQNEPALGKFQIEIEKARALARFSRDLVDDSEFDIMALIARDGAVNMALLREYAIIAGTGIGSEPLGIMNQPSATSSPTEEQILAVDIEGSTANTISNTISNLGTATKLLTLHYSLPPQYRALPSCAYVMNSTSIAAVRKLVDAQGRFIWIAGFAGEPDTLNGKPCIDSEFMPSDGTDTNKPILFGALEELICPVRRDVSIQVAPERYIDTDEIGLFLSQRMGVGVPNTDAFRFGQV